MSISPSRRKRRAKADSFGGPSPAMRARWTARRAIVQFSIAVEEGPAQASGVAQGASQVSRPVDVPIQPRRPTGPAIPLLGTLPLKVSPELAGEVEVRQVAFVIDLRSGVALA